MRSTRQGITRGRKFDKHKYCCKQKYSNMCDLPRPIPSISPTQIPMHPSYQHSAAKQFSKEATTLDKRQPRASPPRSRLSSFFNSLQYIFTGFFLQLTRENLLQLRPSTHLNLLTWDQHRQLIDIGKAQTLGTGADLACFN